MEILSPDALDAPDVPALDALDALELDFQASLDSLDPVDSIPPGNGLQTSEMPREASSCDSKVWTQRWLCFPSLCDDSSFGNALSTVAE